MTEKTILKRLGKLYSETYVQSVADSLDEARKTGNQVRLDEILQSFSYRMHDLSEFMKNLLQRFSSWFNRKNERKGTLWEDRFTSVIVESGTASKTIAAYIDLNPVRAGMVADPADYRWSSYGEAVGGGKKARAGLVRALRGEEGREGSAEDWAQDGLSKEYRALLLRAAMETFREEVDGEIVRTRQGMSKERKRSF